MGNFNVLCRLQLQGDAPYKMLRSDESTRLNLRGGIITPSQCRGLAKTVRSIGAEIRCACPCEATCISHQMQQAITEDVLIIIFSSKFEAYLKAYSWRPCLSSNGKQGTIHSSAFQTPSPVSASFRTTAPLWDRPKAHAWYETGCYNLLMPSQDDMQQLQVSSQHSLRVFDTPKSGIEREKVGTLIR